MTDDDADELYREACRQYLAACFSGAAPGTLRALAQAVYVTREEMEWKAAGRDREPDTRD